MAVFNVFKVECYKIYIKKSFLLLFIVILGVELYSFSLKHDTSSFINPVAQSIYKEEINKLQGKIDNEKSNHVFEKTRQSIEYVEQIQSSYNNLNLTYKLLNENPNVFEKAEVFALLKSQTEFIQEDVEHRYYLDTAAWDLLMNDNNLDFLLILFVITMSSFIFSNEYNSKMDFLNRSAQKGRVVRYLVQLLAISGGSFLLFASVNLGRYFILLKQIGESATYPIQSLPYFGHAFFNLNIIQTYLLMTLFDGIGVLLLVSLLSFVAYFLKSATMVFFTGLITVFVPYYMFGQYIIYHYPLPVSWFLGLGLVRGPEAVNLSMASLRMSLEMNDFLLVVSLTFIFVLVLIYFNIRLQKRGELL